MVAVRAGPGWDAWRAVLVVNVNCHRVARFESGTDCWPEVDRKCPVAGLHRAGAGNAMALAVRRQTVGNNLQHGENDIAMIYGVSLD